MESLQLLLYGFTVALQPENLLLALVGCLVGTLVGVLPGIGPVAAVAILIPATVALPPLSGIIMLSAIYYGTQYGGTITSVLVNVPGESASAVTCLDGYPMARKGRAGAALAVAAIGSFIGGTTATMALVVIAVPVSTLALKIGPAEFFALTLVGLSLVAGLAGKSLVRGLTTASIGLLVAMVGLDPAQGIPRFSFGRPELLDGFGVVPIAVGVFGLGEIFVNLEQKITSLYANRMGPLMMSKAEAKASVGPIARGTAIGFFLGLIPGIGSVVPTFISYAVERRVSKTPERFGQGAIEGVAGPETANNAYANAALIPMFTLGIPSSPTVAVLMGAFLMNGLTPGPFLFTEHPDIAWGLIASLYLGNVILLVLNLPLIPLWVRLLRTPYPIMISTILVLSVVGTYSISGSAFDVAAMLGWGVVGYTLKKLDFPVAPLMLTFILGPLMERNLRSTMQLAGGDWSFFLHRPAALALFALVAVILFLSARRGARSVRGGDSEA